MKTHCSLFPVSAGILFRLVWKIHTDFTPTYLFTATDISISHLLLSVLMLLQWLLYLNLAFEAQWNRFGTSLLVFTLTKLNLCHLNVQISPWQLIDIQMGVSALDERCWDCLLLLNWIRLLFCRSLNWILNSYYSVKWFALAPYLPFDFGWNAVIISSLLLPTGT